MKPGPCALLALALGGSACASVPRGAAAVDAVYVEGNKAVSSNEVQEKMATTSSPKFLEVVRGLLNDYELYDQSVFQRDLARVQRYYAARGFHEARVRAGRVHYKNPEHVEVTVNVEEGPPVVIGAMRIEGAEGLSRKEMEALRKVMAGVLAEGKRFEELPFLRAEGLMRRALTDSGHAWAKVERRADVDLPAHVASLTFTVRPGPKAVFGAIRIKGLGDLPEAPVRRALDIDPDEPYSTATLETAQRAVLDLGTFSSAEVLPQLPEAPPPGAVVPIVVRLQRQKLKTVLVGGGFELDSIRVDTHFHVGWEHKNLFGGFRHFTIDFRPGLDLYPTRLPDFQPPTAVLPKERLIARFRQPGFLEARTSGVVSQELNVYPILLATKVDPKAPVLGYLEYKGSLGLERTFWRLLVTPTYSLQFNQPFAYSGALDRDLRGLLISFVDLFARFDFRDDPLRPHEGFYAQNDVQVAGIGGDALDVRIQPEVRGYFPFGKKVTLVARGTVGFLFPLNYGGAARAAQVAPESGIDRAAWIRDLELVYLRGFFSGGPSSNRGYPLRGVGPHGAVPFFNPGLQAQALASYCSTATAQTSENAARCALPVGGLSLWEASLEIRFPIAGAFGGATFCDASDVSAQEVHLRFDHPHLSCGLGLRYETPIGPIRIDAAYRIPGVQVPGGTASFEDGDPGNLWGAPIAVAFGIGEAF